jgi:hypothetical protein
VSPPAPSARDFESRFRQLLSALGSARDNDGCIQCVGCRACQSSTFCRDSERLVRCHYCVRCSLCTDCSHCSGSRGLVGCQHCIDCESSSASSYLVRCVAVARSSYCFGCVGISNKDFQILNEPYPRDAYFQITRQLMQELRIGA